MMPIQISRRLREWRNEQETENQRAELIGNCILAAAPRKRGSKYKWQHFYGKPKPKLIKQPDKAEQALRAWADDVNQAFR